MTSMSLVGRIPPDRIVRDQETDRTTTHEHHLVEHRSQEPRCILQLLDVGSSTHALLDSRDQFPLREPSLPDATDSHGIDQRQ